ncbi:sugar translocase [Variovorax sp. LjRoot130]|uniref:DUF7024 domain-containing protein n=1 Tax=Variovorax sp. LjRoot130 TaxID=3342261 RepID=UPI003ECF04E3
MHREISTARRMRIGGRDVAIVLIASIATTWFALYCLGGHAFKWALPLLYKDGDAMIHLLLIKRLWDGYGYFTSNAAGFPFGSVLYDFPGSDGGSLLFLWAIGKLSKDSALTFNIYYILGFPAAFASAYLVLRKFDISQPSSTVAAILFAFTYFHFFRLGHLYYSWYFTIPVFVWLGTEVARRSDAISFASIKHWSFGAQLILCICLASFGVYYAFFGAILIGLCGIFGSVQARSLKPFQHSVVACAMLALGALINIAPNLIYFAEHGKNSAVAARHPAESEIYGLKITQLLLPQDSHRSEIVASASRRYNTSFPLVNENASSSLGLVASAAFLCMLLLGALPSRPSQSITPRSHIRLLAFLTISIVLLCTIGGFSSLFAQFVSSQIRAWNRVSIFLVFLALTGLAYGLDSVRRGSPLVSTILCILILALGLWDQTPKPNVAALSKRQMDYVSDRDYVRKIEASLPTGSAIYQMPYMKFPESESVGTLGSYELALGFIHSRDLKWSFGAIAGRQGDDFFRALSQRPIPVQLEIARYLGFKGIYMDRRGYTDGGKAIESELQAQLREPPLTHPSGSSVFYAFGPVDPDHPRRLSESAQSLLETFAVSMKDGRVIIGEMPAWIIDFKRSALTQLRSASGLYAPESWGTWSNGYEVKLQFKKPLPLRLSLELAAQAFGPNAGLPFEISVGKIAKTVALNGDDTSIRLDFDLPRPTDTLIIKVPRPISPQQLGIGQDARALGIGLHKLTITPRSGPSPK